MDAERIFVTSSMQEAMYLLEHCTNLAIGNVKSSCCNILLLTDRFDIRFLCFCFLRAFVYMANFFVFIA